MSGEGRESLKSSTTCTATMFFVNLGHTWKSLVLSDHHPYVEPAWHPTKKAYTSLEAWEIEDSKTFYGSTTKVRTSTAWLTMEASAHHLKCGR